MNWGFALILSVLLLAQTAAAQKNTDSDRIGEHYVVIENQAFRLVDQADIGNYLSGLSQRIAANSDAKIPVTAKLIESDDVNAYTIAGGTFYVTTGLLRYVDNEAELASVIANCVAHIAARHLLERPQDIVDVVNGGMRLPDLMFMPLSSESPPTLFIGGSSPSLVSSAQKFYRDQVSEADVLALKYLYKSGYDPDAAIRLLVRLNAQPPKQNSPRMLLFPSIADRIKAQQKELKKLSARAQSVVTTSDFDRMKQLLPPQ
jgi:predicted Zn-dependent protease